MTLALRAKGRRFNSGSAHFPIIDPFESKLFSVFSCENCVISCFKWFSNVLLRVKPRSWIFCLVFYLNIILNYTCLTTAFAPLREEVYYLLYVWSLTNQRKTNYYRVLDFFMFYPKEKRGKIKFFLILTLTFYLAS